MHDQLFSHQHALEDRNLSRYARHIGLDVNRFSSDMFENIFEQQIEADYNRSLFDEHVTGTPTFYLNEVRYTGATDADSLVHAILQADTEGRIRLPEKSGGIRGMLGRLHVGGRS